MSKKLDCLCGTCLTKQQNPETGYCINDHDNWIEPRDVSIFLSMDIERSLGEHPDSTYPYIVPMFKALAKRIGYKYKDFLNRLKKEPSFIFIRNLQKI